MLKYSIILKKKSKKGVPQANPNLIFSTNFAAIFYYFEKWVLQAITIWVFQNFDSWRRQFNKVQFVFCSRKAHGWKINNDSCLEDMRKKELEARQMGQCSTNLITCYKTFHFGKKNSYAKLMLGQKDFTIFGFTKFVGSCKS